VYKLIDFLRWLRLWFFMTDRQRTICRAVIEVAIRQRKEVKP